MDAVAGVADVVASTYAHQTDYDELVLKLFILFHLASSLCDLGLKSVYAANSQFVFTAT